MGEYVSVYIFLYLWMYLFMLMYLCLWVYNICLFDRTSMRQDADWEKFKAVQ